MAGDSASDNGAPVLNARSLGKRLFWDANEKMTFAKVVCVACIDPVVLTQQSRAMLGRAICISFIKANARINM